MEQLKNPNPMFWGLILGAALIFLYLPFYLTNNLEGSWSDYAAWVLILGVTYLGVKASRQQQGDHFSIGTAVKQGVIIGLVGGAIEGIFKAAYTAFVDPEILEYPRMLVIQEMEKNPSMTEEGMEMATKFVDVFLSPGGVMVLSFIGTLFVALIGGVIWGLILRDNNQN